jgi:hypothetical protein
VTRSRRTPATLILPMLFGAFQPPSLHGARAINPELHKPDYSA